MKRTLTLVMIVLGLILSACAVVLPAQSIAENPLSTSTAAQHIAAALKIVEQTLEPGSAPVVKPGTLESSLLVAGWNSHERQYQLYPFHPESGKALPGYEPITIGAHFYQASSLDRSQLAFIVFNSSEIPTGGSLLLVDLQHWSARATPLDLDGGVTAHSLNPDGRFLALAVGNRESRVILIDLERQAILAQHGLNFLASRLNYASDGSVLFVYGTPIKNRFTVNESAAGPPQAVMLDGGDLGLLWSVELTGVRDGIYPKEGSMNEDNGLHQPGGAVYNLPGVVFAPDRDALYIVHSALDRLTSVDFVAREVVTIDIQPQLSWFERLLWLTAGVARAKVAEGASLRAKVSPDGKLLYVVGSIQELLETNPEEMVTALPPKGGSFSDYARPNGPR